MCGAPGVGKSTIKDMILANRGLHPAILADPDEVFSYMSSEQKENPNCRSLATDILIDRYMDKFIEMRHNIVYDTTCRIISNTKKVVQKLSDAGYYIIVVVVYASVETSIARVGNSGTRSRKLPNNAIRHIHEQLKERVSAYHDLGNELMFYNNDYEPVLMYHRIFSYDPFSGRTYPAVYSVPGTEALPFYYNYRQRGRGRLGGSGRSGRSGRSRGTRKIRNA
jgi:predicted ABC-type ATPase